MAAARSEGTQRIIDGQLRPAVERALAGSKQRRRAHLTLANFLAELYQRRSERLKSEEMVRQVELLNTRKKELEATMRQVYLLRTRNGRTGMVKSLINV